MTYDNVVHVPPTQFISARPMTVMLNSMPKTYHTPGWRIGYMLATRSLTAALRKLHGSITYCAPVPLQARATAAYHLLDSSYAELREKMQHKRDQLARILAKAELRPHTPQGAMFVCADISDTGYSGIDC